MRIPSGLGDPDQKFIDAQVANLAANEIEMYQRFRAIDGCKQLVQDFTPEQLADRYAFMWNRELEQRVKTKAWFIQNTRDETVAYARGVANAEGGLRVMQIVAELDKQGRKTVKIADLIEAFKESHDDF